MRPPVAGAGTGVLSAGAERRAHGNPQTWEQSRACEVSNLSLQNFFLGRALTMRGGVKTEHGKDDREKKKVRTEVDELWKNLHAHY